MVLSTKEIVISKNVTFKEHLFPFRQTFKDSVKTSENIMQGDLLPCDDPYYSDLNVDQLVAEHEADTEYDRLQTVCDDNVARDTTSDNVTEDDLESPDSFDQDQADEPCTEIQVRKSSRAHKSPTWKKDYVCSVIHKSPHHLEKFVGYVNCPPSHKAFSLSISAIKEPSTYGQARNDQNWVQAMEKEIDALELNKTWILSDPPHDKTLVDCKWVYKVKYNSDGSVERYKARLVARGFTQVEGIDYQETFALVAKMTTVRCLLAIAAARGWPLYQLDVNNAFLHGVLEEEVYMKLLPGFYETEKSQGKVCRLIKSL